ncbi:universal stress protein [Plastorhodobacter daqingensis]|uniref:Universal stress protein n=1 Tax=Plastorhodobacter daqingensis TaxID=1387281 RepID=A0ABW2UMA2_9RHOB
MYQTIIVAVALGGDTTGGPLLERATRLLAPGGSIKLVHVLEEVPAYIVAELPRDVLSARKAEAMVELRDLAAAQSAAADCEVRQGSPATAILEAAADHGADLIMIASHRPDLRDYFIGSTAARVVRHAKCSVLISR